MRMKNLLWALVAAVVICSIGILVFAPASATADDLSGCDYAATYPSYIGPSYNPNGCPDFTKHETWSFSYTDGTSESNSDVTGMGNAPDVRFPNTATPTSTRRRRHTRRPCSACIRSTGRRRLGTTTGTR